MANTKSALKNIRKSEKKRIRNRYYRSTARTYIKKVRNLIAEGRLEEAKPFFQRAISALDKAAEKGIIHKRNAARRKSRLARLFNRALAGQTVQP